jgi:hypothetical protein
VSILDHRDHRGLVDQDAKDRMRHRDAIIGACGSEVTPARGVKQLPERGQRNRDR